jgi:hypothetical protein
MSLISPGLTAIPAIVAIAAVFGRMLAPLAREVRLTMVAWLALRGTQPDERPEILRALAGAPHQVGRTMTIPEVASTNDGAKQQGSGRRGAQRLSSRSGEA